MLKKWIEKLYSALYQQDSEEQVPYANKKVMFWVTIGGFAIVLFFILRDVMHNIQQMK